MTFTFDSGNLFSDLFIFLIGLNLLEKEYIIIYFIGFVGYLWKVNKCMKIFMVE